MEPALAAATVAASVAIVGWFVTSALSRRSALATARRDAALRHLERQLGELYGPLAFTALEGKRVFNDLLDDFGPEWGAGTRELTPAELDKWMFWADNFFIPRNDRIQELLSTKAHLIEGDHLPDSFVAFVDHHGSWRLDYLRARETGVREGLFSRRPWPVDFTAEVLQTFASLKHRHAELLGQQLPYRAVDHLPPTGTLDADRND